MDRGNIHYYRSTKHQPGNLLISRFTRGGNQRDLLRTRITKDGTANIPNRKGN